MIDRSRPFNAPSQVAAARSEGPGIEREADADAGAAAKPEPEAEALDRQGGVSELGARKLLGPDTTYVHCNMLSDTEPQVDPISMRELRDAVDDGFGQLLLAPARELETDLTLLELGRSVRAKRARQKRHTQLKIAAAIAAGPTGAEKSTTSRARSCGACGAPGPRSIPTAPRACWR